MTLLFSGDGTAGSSPIRQNAQFWLGQGDRHKSFTLDPHESLPHAWIQVVSGGVQAGEHLLAKADGLAIEHIDQTIDLTCKQDSVFFLFRLPAS
jgi:redox-sensitive bicupin YhaK (pirin superfamily)